MFSFWPLCFQTLFLPIKGGLPIIWIDQFEFFFGITWSLTMASRWIGHSQKPFGGMWTIIILEGVVVFTTWCCEGTNGKGDVGALDTCFARLTFGLYEHSLPTSPPSLVWSSFPLKMCLLEHPINSNLTSLKQHKHYYLVPLNHGCEKVTIESVYCPWRSQ
jgi:hypothetical protein